LKESESTALEKFDRTFIKHLTLSTPQGKFFRVDTNLRPYGAQGSLTGSFSYYRDYYRKKAQGWELQSWLKARPVAGNLELGKKLIEEVHKEIWQADKQEAIETSLQKVRMKSLRSLSREHLDADVKQGPGGIRTIEFFVQSRQIQYGRKYPEIITGHTLQGLERLKQSGLITEQKHTQLHDAYLFLRSVEHSLQLEGMQQRSLLPPEGPEFSRLAKRMGFEDRLHETAEAQLLKLLRQHTSMLKQVSEELFPESTELYE
jgi:glutamate-ammonia-ligase adenylyltransferase